MEKNSIEDESAGVFFWVPRERNKITVKQVVARKLILLPSNTSKDGIYEIMDILHEKEADLNTYP